MRVDTQIRLRQPLGASQEVSYQLFAGDQILASAFEERPDMLCVPRQLAELLKLSLEDILQDFDAICSGDWRQRGVSPTEIRTFCVWRNAPMFFVDCLGSWIASNPCRRKKGPLPTPPGTDTLSSTKAPGRWWAATIATVGSARTPARSGDRLWPLLARRPAKRAGPAARSGAPAQGGAPRTLRMVRPAPASIGRRLRDSRELCEDAQVLQECTQRLGVPYRGQRLAGASLEVFLHLLQRRRDNTSSRRAALLAEQDGMCKLCGAPITAQTCELDHIVPVRQAYQGQALHHGAPGLVLRMPQSQNQYGGESQHHSGEPLVSLRLPELRRQPSAAAPGLPAAEMGRRAPLPGHRRVPLPEERAGQRSLPHSGACGSHLRGPALRRPQGASGLAALYVGRGWYSKSACAEMLDSGLAQWRHFRWSLEATAHVDQRWLEQALTMEEAWPEGEEHMAKLSINALVGLFARNLDLVYSIP